MGTCKVLFHRIARLLDFTRVRQFSVFEAFDKDEGLDVLGLDKTSEGSIISILLNQTLAIGAARELQKHKFLKLGILVRGIRARLLRTVIRLRLKIVTFKRLTRNCELRKLILSASRFFLTPSVDPSFGL